jgi:hypothetical protein
MFVEQVAKCRGIRNGPFIPTILQRPEGVEADFAALDNFGVGEGEKYFGGDDA